MGQVRLPFVGGLYTPDWRDPGRECGCYYSEDGEREIALYRGLRSTERILRFHNIPETQFSLFNSWLN